MNSFLNLINTAPTKTLYWHIIKIYYNIVVYKQLVIMENISITFGVSNEDRQTFSSIVKDKSMRPTIRYDEDFRNSLKGYDTKQFWESVQKEYENKFRKPLSITKQDLSKLDAEQMEIFISYFISFLTNYKKSVWPTCWAENKIWFFLPAEKINQLELAVSKKINFCLNNPEFPNLNKDLHTARNLNTSIRRWNLWNFVFDINKIESEEKKEKFLNDLYCMLTLFSLAKEVNKESSLS